MYVCTYVCMYSTTYLLTLVTYMLCFMRIAKLTRIKQSLLNNLVSTSYTIVETINKQHDTTTVGLVTYTYKLSQ